VVQQSYEDKDYDGSPRPVLVPLRSALKQSAQPRAAPAVGRDRGRNDDSDDDRFDGADAGAACGGSLLGADPLLENFTDRRNMLMQDDTRPGDDEDLFDDTNECGFDDGFIHEIMYGDPAGVGEAEDGDAAEEGGSKTSYPVHDTSARAIDRQFDAMMREFDVDEGINDAEGGDDPRTHGPLEVNQYLGALEEFVEGNAGYDFHTAMPRRNIGLLHQLQRMVHRQGVFDSNRDGVFVTTLLPDKESRFAQEFKEETERLHLAALRNLQGLREQDQRSSAGGADGSAPEERQPTGAEEMEDMEVLTLKQKDRFDCETVLSTYSTLYNHPNVIAASKRRSAPVRIGAGKLVAPEARVPKVEVGNSPPPDAVDLRRDVDFSFRPENETAEEKRQRRRGVKQQQRERREKKKELREAYGSLSAEQAAVAKRSRASRGQQSLSLVRGATR
jgi:protein LTV1